MEQMIVVGRQNELAALRAAFESAAGGHGGMLCLAGEPGIGKTTIVELFLAELAASGTGCYLARGRCSERLAGSEAYLPVLEALETLVKGGDESLGRLMSVVAPTWYVQIVPLIGGSAADLMLGESRRASQERLKRELVAFLGELTRRNPVVFFVDDLHWADVSTIDVLSYVATRCGSQRILIVGAYRPSDPPATDRHFLRVKLELQGHGSCREILMPFLTCGDVDRYLDLQFPEHRFPAELSSRIHDRTEGNPLFMTDLVRYLRDRGAFAHCDGRWVMVDRLPEIEQELPESVRSLIHKKISQLSDGDRRLMTAAAVQGHEFESTVVARALAMDPTEAEERLEVLDHTHGFVRLIGDRELSDCTLTLRYRFIHVLYQNALHNALTATRKASLSLAVARALMQSYQDQTADLASQDAAREFQIAFRTLEHHACPTIEWQIFRAAAVAADARGETAARTDLMGRARAIVHTLAGSIRDDGLRRKFLGAEPIRELFS